ncbi:protein of unknown function DUF2634 [Gottschalkia purinilytica]|uniref:Phage protein n=1 Tax=Gottschalkia purinilytica TaxID=1503 RepID=A0A0L0WEZ3_GOTPU|nr:DUF2634 domain-containing protein [Gottschalkia purinilytica]KNF10052.1 protein of unknown function DUF2634 [Gottschalkia purinilytica]
MSIFPFIEPPTDRIIKNQELPLFCEYAWDFEKNIPLLLDGKLKKLEGNKALEVWIYKALKTERYRYLAYSWDYGHELESIIGSTFSRKAKESEVKRYVEEALTVNPYIKEISEFRVEFDKDNLYLEFVVKTVYGEVDIVV